MGLARRAACFLYAIPATACADLAGSRSRLGRIRRIKQTKSVYPTLWRERSM